MVCLLNVTKQSRSTKLGASVCSKSSSITAKVPQGCGSVASSLKQLHLELDRGTVLGQHFTFQCKCQADASCPTTHRGQTCCLWRSIYSTTQQQQQIKCQESNRHEVMAINGLQRQWIDSLSHGSIEEGPEASTPNHSIKDEIVSQRQPEQTPKVCTMSGTVVWMV